MSNQKNNSKNRIPQKNCNTAFDCYKEVGFKISKNRGDASGRYKNGKKQYRKWDKKGKTYELEKPGPKEKLNKED